MIIKCKIIQFSIFSSRKTTNLAYHMFHACLSMRAVSVVPHVKMEVNTFGILVSVCVRVCVCFASLCKHTKYLFMLYRIMRQHVHQHVIKSEHVAINSSNKHREPHISHIASIIIIAIESARVCDHLNGNLFSNVQMCVLGLAYNICAFVHIKEYSAHFHLIHFERTYLLHSV